MSYRGSTIRLIQENNIFPRTVLPVGMIVLDELRGREGGGVVRLHRQEIKYNITDGQ